MSTDVTSTDPFVRDVRREISDVDSALVELVNKRLRLVAKLSLRAASCVSFVSGSALGLAGLSRRQMTVALGTAS